MEALSVGERRRVWVWVWWVAWCGVEWSDGWHSVERGGGEARDGWGEGKGGGLWCWCVLFVGGGGWT